MEMFPQPPARKTSAMTRAEARARHEGKNEEEQGSRMLAEPGRGNCERPAEIAGRDRVA